MDIVAGGAIVAVAKYLGGPAAELIERAAGPAADEIGKWLQEKAVEFRRRNASDVAQRAAEMIKEVEAEPREIPPRVLFPLLEAASLESEKALQERWAAMLANASLEGTQEPIHSHILSQLRIEDARVLDAVGQIDRTMRATHALENPNQTAYVAVRNQISTITGDWDAIDREVSIDTLIALRCIEPEPALYPAQDDRLERLDHGFRLTHLGRRFLAVVTPPASVRAQ